ncbi:MAG TPA: hypothetical protein VF493_12400 [Terriglobales bacterium]
MTRLLLALLLLSSEAMAHSWYPMECCHDQDCRKVPCDELVETPNGYLFDGVTFSKAMERPSKDRWCHVCIMGSGGGRRGLCVFTQQGS